LNLIFDTRGKIKFVNDDFLKLFEIEDVTLFSNSVFSFLNDKQKMFLLKNWASILNGNVFKLITHLEFCDKKSNCLLLTINYDGANSITVKAFDLTNCGQINKFVSIMNRVLNKVDVTNLFYSNLKYDIDIYFSNLKKIPII
jgi:hypothetical protein